ncbi:MAG TPA: cytochrome c oxidase assembly protein [Gaiellaceae bacterium]|nr:cytochrome c oxidase assembly protein [Gaiellaceae bacterium]
MSALLPLAHGDRVAVSELAGAWEAAPAVIAASVVALALFAQAFARLRRRGRADHAPWSRAWLFAVAVAVAALALLSPLDAVGEEYLLSGHMLQHVLIGDVAPALALVALRGPLVFFLLPAAILRALAPVQPLRTALGALLRPRVALAVWAVTMAAWHVPQAYGYTLTHQLAHDLEHATFAVAGTLVWIQIADPARRRELTTAGRLVVVAVLFAAGQVLANVLVFSFSPLYEAYALQDERLLGLSARTDQRLAGLVMMVEQVLVLGLAAAVLLRAYDREKAVRRSTTLGLAADR